MSVHQMAVNPGLRGSHTSAGPAVVKVPSPGPWGSPSLLGLFILQCPEVLKFLFLSRVQSWKTQKSEILTEEMPQSLRTCDEIGLKTQLLSWPRVRFSTERRCGTIRSEMGEANPRHSLPVRGCWLCKCILFCFRALVYQWEIRNS